MKYIYCSFWERTKLLDFTEQTVLLNDRSVRKRTKKMNDNFENEQNNNFTIEQKSGRWKKVERIQIYVVP